jgi:EmrB/QacA subfamily drug resistance transporter
VVYGESLTKPPRLSSPTRVWVLTVTSAALAMTFVDETGVGVALATIRRELHTTGATTHWVVNAYMLTMAALVAAGGRLSDRFGHRRVFLAGLAGFAAGSALSSAAPDSLFLILSRVLQGGGGALLVPTTLALLTDAFEPEQRGRAVGIYIGAASVFYVVGPLLAGLLTELVSWRALFWINLPAAAAVASITLRRVPAGSDGGDGERLDVAGLCALAAGLALVVSALMTGPSWGWGSPDTFALMAVGVVILIAFVRLERRNAHPLLDLELFVNRRFSAGTAIVFLVYFVYLGVVVFVPLFLQHEAGLGPLQASVGVVAGLGPIIVSAPLAGRLADRFGARRPAIASAGAAIASFSWLALSLDAHDLLSLIPCLILYAFSVPMLYTIAAAVTQNAVAEHQRGQASGIIATAAQAGAAFGVAVLGAIVVEISGAADYSTSGFQAAFLACAALGAVMAALATMLPDKDRAAAAVGRGAAGDES